MSRTIPSIVIGATGYVGGELLRLIAGHGVFDLHAAVSTSAAGRPVRSVYPSLSQAYPDAVFVTPDAALVDVPAASPVAIFSAAPHGASAEVVRMLLEMAGDRSIDAHVVDVSADFRYPDAASFAAVYGSAHAAPGLLGDFSCAVPEHLAKATTPHIGHPGCFATAVLLASVPLYQEGLVEGAVYATGVTGSTGSGRSPQPGTHHPERHGNLYAYKPLAHRHVPEIERLIRAATGARAALHFIPHSGPFARGIYVTVQAPLANPVPAADIADRIARYYADSPFVDVVDGPPRLKNVVVSNRCHLGVAADGDTVVVMAAIDNLVKGAAGGALQWMNRLWDLPETTGLTVPAPAWT